MNTIRRRLGCLALTAALLCGLIPAALAASPGLSNFKHSKTYTPGQFTDVPAGIWYEGNVQTACELGLTAGTEPDTFSPEADMDLAMAVTLAARLHCIYHTGSADGLVQGTPWYQVYVDYALANGILTPGQFSDYSAQATRAQCALLLSRAIPEEELPPINTVEEGAIPDVSADAPCYDAVYLLYRAGILTGNDGNGTFAPDTPIDRAALFTIATRLADPSLRKSLTLKVKTPVTVKPTLWLYPGDTYQLTASPVPATAELPPVTWTSSDPTIATVSDTGLVTMLAPGKTSITVTTAEGLSAVCTANVMRIPVTGLTLNHSEISLYGDQVYQLTADTQPVNASPTPIQWSSSNPAVATVSDTGLVTGVGTGTATIKAWVYNGTHATCTVTVSRVFTQVNGVTYIDGVLIANKSYSMPKDYRPGLRPETSAAFQAMKQAAAADGISLWICSGYRSYWTQVNLYNGYVARYGQQASDRFSARPGYSEHQAGLALDVNSVEYSFGETAAGKWLAQHCAEYGFVIRYPQGKEEITGYRYEPWHVRYVGKELAQQLYLGEGDFLTLEEYFGITSCYSE